MLRHRLAVALSLLLGTATAGAAQVSLGVGGAYVSLGGQDFAILKPGVGAEANLLLSLGRSLELGVGAQYTWHGIEGADGTRGVLGVLGEGRFMLGSGPARPYLAVRGGVVRAIANDEDFTGDGNPDEVSAAGSVFGGGGGVVLSLSPSLALDVGAAFHTVSFGDIEFNGNPLPGTDLNGTALQFRGVLRFGRR